MVFPETLVISIIKDECNHGIQLGLIKKYKEDEKIIVEFAKDLYWPPVPTEMYPFWKLEE